MSLLVHTALYNYRVKVCMAVLFFLFLFCRLFVDTVGIEMIRRRLQPSRRSALSNTWEADGYVEETIVS